MGRVRYIKKIGLNCKGKVKANLFVFPNTQTYNQVLIPYGVESHIQSFS